MVGISESISKRKSVRAYLDKPVTTEDLEQVVEAGRWAPCFGQFQISVIRSGDVRKQLNDEILVAMRESGITFLQERASLPGYQPLYDAPVLVLLSGPDDNPYSAHNTALAAENMILEATERGLGSCYLVTPTLVTNGGSKSTWAPRIGVPEGYTVQCAVIVGYAASENGFSEQERASKGTLQYID